MDNLLIRRHKSTAGHKQFINIIKGRLVQFLLILRHSYEVVGRQDDRDDGNNSLVRLRLLPEEHFLLTGKKELRGREFEIVGRNSFELLTLLIKYRQAIMSFWSCLLPPLVPQRIIILLEKCSFYYLNHKTKNEEKRVILSINKLCKEILEAVSRRFKQDKEG